MNKDKVEKSVNLHFAICQNSSDSLGEFNSYEEIKSRKREIFDTLYDNYKKVSEEIDKPGAFVCALAWHKENNNPALISMVESAICIDNAKIDTAKKLMNSFMKSSEFHKYMEFVGFIVIFDSWISIIDNDDTEEFKNLKPSEDPFRHEAIYGSLMTDDEDVSVNQIYTKEINEDGDLEVKWGRIETVTKPGGKYDKIF